MNLTKLIKNSGSAAPVHLPTVRASSESFDVVQDKLRSRTLYRITQDHEPTGSWS